MSSIVVDVETLSSLIRDAVADAMRRPTSRANKALISAAEADRSFRLAKGTAAAAFRAGLLRGEERAGQSRTGRVVWIRTEDAAKMWGGSRATDLAQGGK
jgi:hypothetical protein